MLRLQPLPCANARHGGVTVRARSGAPAWLLPFTPLAGFAFLALSFVAWRAGVARYPLTGS